MLTHDADRTWDSGHVAKAAHLEFLAKEYRMLRNELNNEAALETRT